MDDGSATPHTGAQITGLCTSEKVPGTSVVDVIHEPTRNVTFENLYRQNGGKV